VQTVDLRTYPVNSEIYGQICIKFSLIIKQMHILKLYVVVVLFQCDFVLER